MGKSLSATRATAIKLVGKLNEQQLSALITLLRSFPADTTIGPSKPKSGTQKELERALMQAKAKTKVPRPPKRLPPIRASLTDMFGPTAKSGIPDNDARADDCSYCVEASDDPHTEEPAILVYFEQRGDALDFASSLDLHGPADRSGAAPRRFDCVWVAEKGSWTTTKGKVVTDWVYFSWSKGATTAWGDPPARGYGRPHKRKTHVEYRSAAKVSV